MNVFTPWVRDYSSRYGKHCNNFMGVAEVMLASTVIGAGVGIYSSNNASDAADAATKANSQAAADATALQKYQFDTQQANMKPWLTAGTTAVNQLNTGLQSGGQFSTAPASFQFDQSKVATDPGYAFRQQQGVNALTAAGAAAGNLGSGNLGVALQNYGQELGSQEYQNAYTRQYGQQMDQYNSGLNAQNTLFNRLSGVAGTGQTAANQIGSAGMNMANNVGNIATQTAQTNGNIGMQSAQQQSNALGGIAQTGINAYGAYNQNQLYQNYLNGQQGTGYQVPGNYNYSASYGDQ